MTRRQAILALGSAPQVAVAARAQGFYYGSQGRVFVVRTDGDDGRELRFDVPKVVSWQPGPAFSDGRRQLMVGWEQGPVFKGTVRSQLWICDVSSGELLDEVCTKERLAPYYAPVALLPGDERVLVSGVLDDKGRLFNMRLNGSDAKEVATPQGGYSYGFALSPDGRRLAFHTTGPKPLNYRISVSDLDGGDAVSVASAPPHLYFGPVWSPDSHSLLYLDCQSHTDAGHDWADLCIGKPDGSSHRVATSGQCLWFASSYGIPGNRGNGSIIPEWSPDGAVIVVNRRMTGSTPPWEFQTQRPDTDHFNRDYHPERARGGTQICLLHPAASELTELTTPNEGEWNWGGRFTKDGKQLLFHRAQVGETPAIWIMNANGSGQRMLTRGKDNKGAIFARWMPS